MNTIMFLAAHVWIRCHLQPEISLFRFLLFFSRSRDLRWLISAHNVAAVSICMVFWGRLQGTDVLVKWVAGMARQLNDNVPAPQVFEVNCSMAGAL